MFVPDSPAGLADGGVRVDAGDVEDAGDAMDAGALDAGQTDAGAAVDAGQADAGQTDAGQTDAGAPDAGTTGCMDDGACQIGEICEGGACVEGCRSARDCPATAPQCDQSQGQAGTCVECTAASHCADGEVCNAGTCAAGCSADAPNCAEGVCDVATGLCVPCMDDSHCAIGQICESQQCTDGCRTARDCPAEQICRDSQCVNGCTPGGDECALGTYCDASGTCQLGCGGDDARCGEGYVCDANTCVEACQDTDDCGSGRACVMGRCQEGCLSADDCDEGEPHCTAVGGQPGSCVECRAQSDCADNRFRPVCNVEAGVCTAECDPMAGFDQCSVVGWVCDPVRTTCVECVVDDDCDQGICDATSGSCMSGMPEPAEQCDACEEDADCGGMGLCARRRLGFGNVDRFCAQDCSMDPTSCPQGTACEFIGEPVRGQVCVPVTAAADAASCSGRRAFLEERECRSQFSCRGGPDALCSGYGSSDGFCSVWCLSDADCPAGAFCEDPPAVDGEDPEPRCALLPAP